MKQYRFPEKNIWKAAFCIYLFVLLLLARDTLITTCLVGFYPSQLTVAGLIVALGFLFLGIKRRELPQLMKDRRMLAFAIAAVLITLVHFPLIPTAAFLRYDPADVAILIGAFAGRI